MFGYIQGRIGHVTSVNGKIQNNVIYRTSLLLLATPDVRCAKPTVPASYARGSQDRWRHHYQLGPLDGVLHSISDGPSRFLSTVSIDQDS